jgi:hypothetical protein
VRGWAPFERWNPPPPSPQAVEAPATGLSVEEPASVAESPASATAAPRALEKEEAGLLQLEVSSTSPARP